MTIIKRFYDKKLQFFVPRLKIPHQKKIKANFQWNKNCIFKKFNKQVQEAIFRVKLNYQTKSDTKLTLFTFRNSIIMYMRN
jgi:hypothetical protein